MSKAIENHHFFTGKAGMEIDYYISLSSPYTYMGHARFEEMAKAHALTVNYRTLSSPEVLAAAGTLALAKRPPSRLAYRMMELKRWRSHLGLSFNLEPRFFPVPDIDAARMVVGAIQAGAHPGALVWAFLRAVWEQERDITDLATRKAIVTETGLDAGDIAQRAQGPGVAAGIEENTQHAIASQVFGYPTWKLDGELFWGQDRLDFLEQALKRA
ncbi:MAG: 2-hydroxychromene-2-carboxylate isomerase [bacterium]